MLREGGECWLDASTFVAFQRRLQHSLAACAQSYIPVRVACWKCDSVSLPGWQLEVLVPPAGVQKINVCFTCASLCSHELDTILSNTVPLVWAESLWIAGKCWPKVAGFFPTKPVVNKGFGTILVTAGKKGERLAKKMSALGQND